VGCNISLPVQRSQVSLINLTHGFTLIKMCVLEIRDLYSLPNIIWVTTFRRIRWTGHVARMGRRKIRVFWSGNL
jgi:hypothetical protein